MEGNRMENGPENRLEMTAISYYMQTNLQVSVRW